MTDEQPAAAAPTGPPPSMFAIFRKRDFRFLWTGQLVSTIGSSLTDLAAGILIFQRTNSALAVGLMLMATAIPSLLVGLVAGVFVDRFSRKKIMIASDLIRAGLVLSIPFLIQIDILLLYLVVVLASSVKQFFDPAEQSVLPDVASEEDCRRPTPSFRSARSGRPRSASPRRASSLRPATSHSRSMSTR
jgi:MFS family permease